jgi:hypothetical protein
MAYSAPADQVVLEIDKTPLAPAVPHEWAQFYAMLSPPGMSSSGTLFLHERTSRSGNRRLVAVDASSSALYGVGPVTVILMPRVVRPGSVLEEPTQVVHTRTGFMFAPEGRRAYAGQPDPNDPSHFTIRFAGASNARVVDGWLGDDDHVVIEPRSAADSPTTRPLR